MVESKLHGLDDVREALGKAQPVIITGAASAADLLQGLGVPAAAVNGALGVAELDDIAQELRGGDIILLRDSDPAFYAQSSVLQHSLAGVAKQVRLIDLEQVWEAQPLKAVNFTVADWVAAENIDAQKLYHLAERTAPTYVEEQKEPEQASDDAGSDTRFQLEYASRFGALPWHDMQRNDVAHYEYIIQGLFPKEEMVLIYGESQSGKSFFTFDAAVHLAAGGGTDSHAEASSRGDDAERGVTEVTGAAVVTGATRDLSVAVGGPSLVAHARGRATAGRGVGHGGMVRTAMPREQRAMSRAIPAGAARRASRRTS